MKKLFFLAVLTAMTSFSFAQGNSKEMPSKATFDGKEVTIKVSGFERTLQKSGGYPVMGDVNVIDQIQDKISDSKATVPNSNTPQVIPNPSYRQIKPVGDRIARSNYPYRNRAPRIKTRIIYVPEVIKVPTLSVYDVITLQRAEHETTDKLINNLIDQNRYLKDSSPAVIDNNSDSNWLWALGILCLTAVLIVAFWRNQPAAATLVQSPIPNITVHGSSPIVTNGASEKSAEKVVKSESIAENSTSHQSDAKKSESTLAN